MTPNEVLSRAGLTDDAIEILAKLADHAPDGWRSSCPDRPTVADVVTLISESAEHATVVRAALSAGSPLVELGLISLSIGDHVAHEQREVRIDDRIVEFFRGDRALDRRLAGVATLHHRPAACDVIARDRIVRALASSGPIMVEGPSQIGKVAAAIAAITTSGSALVCDVAAIAASDDPLGRLAAARREGVLSEARLILRVRHGEAAWTPGLRRSILDLVERGAVLAIRDGSEIARELQGCRRIAVPMPTMETQLAIWRTALGDVDLADVPRRYPLPPGDIIAAAACVRADAELENRQITTADALAAARGRLSHRLGDVAELVSTRLSWSDVVLREDVASKVRELIEAVRLRDRVLVDWGFESKLPYGRAISALLSGAPGTGKTMVATVMGKELGLEVFRVDLSKVVSKFIGETEKNLARVFDEASRCKAILLFDEADSLFSKRTEVKNSNDKFANLEVNFLLQRLETHDGVVMLTTNAASAIDRAFLRRIAFRIEFPEPDADERARLWRTMVPAAAPLAADVDFAALGRTFKMTGGHIKNAVVRAAYRAMTGGKQAIDQATLHQAGQAEWLELGNLTPPDESAPEPRAPEPPRPELARASAPAITKLELTPSQLPSVTAGVETAMVRILTGGLRIGETIESGYRRKEHELATLLGTLTVIEARALQRRLELAATDDVLAQQFARLSRDRRHRLISFLADARRRQAVAAAC